LISSTSRRTNPRWRMANLGLQAAASSHPQSPVRASKARSRGQEEWKAPSGPSETAVAPDGAAWTACEIIGRRLYYEFPFHKGFSVGCARAVAPVSLPPVRLFVPTGFGPHRHTQTQTQTQFAYASWWLFAADGHVPSLCAGGKKKKKKTS
jgi:hypothetical protein